MRILAITVSDRRFFVGTLAAVNSLLHYAKQFPPDCKLEIAVISSGQYNEALTPPQIMTLNRGARFGVKYYPHKHFAKPSRTLGAWQLKAYAAADLAADYDLIFGFDSDLVFCSSVFDVIQKCIADGKFRGGKDGGDITYNHEYRPYGIPAGLSLPYMSTSCYFCPTTPGNLAILKDWADKTDAAKYGPQAKKIYAGHGDQGVLNAVIAARTGAKNVETLPNELWSQHWRYNNDVIEWNGSELINYSANRRPMRTLHCGGTNKFWTKAHANLRLRGGQSQRWAYAQFLRFLHFGILSQWQSDPLQIIDADFSHIFLDALHYHQLIFELDPAIKKNWGDISTNWLSRALDIGAVPRAMTLLPGGGGSMNTYIDLARSLPDKAEIVEVGSFYGGSVIALAAATLDKSPRIVSVESFTGNLDNTVDGHSLPPVDDYIKNVKTTWPYLNINTIALPGQLAAKNFADNSLDMVFIDGDHSTDAVKRDIRLWWPKIKQCGIIAGDDYSWKSVEVAVKSELTDVQNKNSVWWVEKT